MQRASGPAWDCTATKCFYSLGATSHFFPFIGVMKNSKYISLPHVSPHSLSSLHFSATLSIAQSNQALEAT